MEGKRNMKLVREKMKREEVGEVREEEMGLVGGS
jgi:hypothetical protein